MISCPRCESQTLEVVAEVVITLDVKDDELQEVLRTEPEYGERSRYTCAVCGFTSHLESFKS